MGILVIYDLWLYFVYDFCHPYFFPLGTDEFSDSIISVSVTNAIIITIIAARWFQPCDTGCHWQRYLLTYCLSLSILLMHTFPSWVTARYIRLLPSNCLNWKIYCDDHSSLSSTTAVQIWIISYKRQIHSSLFCGAVCFLATASSTISKWKCYFA